MNLTMLRGPSHPRNLAKPLPKTNRYKQTMWRSDTLHSVPGAFDEPVPTKISATPRAKHINILDDTESRTRHIEHRDMHFSGFKQHVAVVETGMRPPFKT